MTLRVVTDSGNLFVRSAPYKGAKPVGRLMRGQTYDADGEQNGWYHFSDIHDERMGVFSGWAMGEFLQPVDKDRIIIDISVSEYNEFIDNLIKTLEVMKK